MRLITSLLIVLYGLTLSAQEQQPSPAIALISAKSTAEYLGQMKMGLLDHGLILNVEREIWKSKKELEEFAFTLTHPETKTVQSYHFKYNDLNKHQIFVIYPDADHRYHTALTDINYLSDELLPILINTEVKREKPVVYKSYDRSGRLYREPHIRAELVELTSTLQETVALHKQIKADQTLGRSLSGILYTYNGAIIDNPKAVDFRDMTADILIEKVSDKEMIINVWSDKPLDNISNGITMAHP